MTRTDQFHFPRLPFPTRPLKVRGGIIEEYIIPEEYREEVLKHLYIFVPVPSLDDEMYDLHEDKVFKVRDYRVVRDGGMDMLVSPYYPNSGGSVIDWVPSDDGSFHELANPCGEVSCRNIPSRSCRD